LSRNDNEAQNVASNIF